MRYCDYRVDGELMLGETVGSVGAEVTRVVAGVLSFAHCDPLRRIGLRTVGRETA